jgi:hypothetical protein
VRVELGSAKGRIVEELLQRPGVDFLSLLGRERDENSHSDVLATLLNPNVCPGVALPALVALTASLPDAAAWKNALLRNATVGLIAVHREYVTGREWGRQSNLDRIDIVVSSPDFVLVIENKTFTREHGRQTERYSDWLAFVDAPLKAAYLLTPTGATAISSEFRALSYLSLVSALLEACSSPSPIAAEESALLVGYLKALSAEILSVELRAARGESLR